MVRLEDMGVRSNGYRVTALAGEDCDACMVIHGDVGAGFGEEDIAILFQPHFILTHSYTQKVEFSISLS